MIPKDEKRTVPDGKQPKAVSRRGMHWKKFDFGSRGRGPKLWQVLQPADKKPLGE
jgi:hypothetical protein